MDKRLFRMSLVIGAVLLFIGAGIGQSTVNIGEKCISKDAMNFCEIYTSENAIAVSSFLDGSEDISSSIIYVDDDYNNSTSGWQEDHFDKIRDAIGASSNGDTIFVYNGVYTGDQYIVIDKSIRLIGEDRESTFINDLYYNDCVVMIEANEVEISGFSIIGKIGYSDLDTTKRGIWLRSERNLIYMNNIYNCEYGVYVNNPDLPNVPIRNNIICNNIISDCNRDGIHICSSHDNCVNYNIITNISCICENNAGVHIVNSAGNQIVDNTIQCRNCIILEGHESQYNTVSTNKLTAIMKVNEGNAVCIYLKNAGPGGFITANHLNKGSQEPTCYLTYMISTRGTTWLGNQYDDHPSSVVKPILGYWRVGIVGKFFLPYLNFDIKPI